MGIQTLDPGTLDLDSNACSVLQHIGVLFLERLALLAYLGRIGLFYGSVPEMCKQRLVC